MNNARRPPGIDELNLAEFPITLLTTRCSKDQNTIESEDYIHDRSTGEPVHRKVTVYASPKYGLPTAEDQDVLVALIDHTKRENDFLNPRVEFSRYKLLKIMGWNDETKNYKRVEESLHRWAQVSIFFENSWRDKSRAKWTTITAHILDRVEINRMAGRRPDDPDEEILSWFTWGQDVFDSIKAGNTKSLDLEFYFKLKSAISRRMYRYLDKKFYQSRELKIDLHKLALEHLGISRSYSDTSQIRRKIQVGIDELIEQKYLEERSKDDIFEQVSRGKCNVFLVRQPDATAKKAIPQYKEPLPLTTENSPIVQSLMAIGVEPNIAINIGNNHTSDEISLYIEFMEWKASTTEKGIADKASWIITALRQKFHISKGFYDAKKKKQEEKNQTEIDIEEANKKQQIRMQEQQQNEQIRAYLESKTEKEIEKLTVEAIQEMDDEFQKSLKEASIQSIIKMMKHSALESHVLKILKERSTAVTSS